jgi:hypothetical protein
MLDGRDLTDPQPAKPNLIPSSGTSPFGTVAEQTRAQALIAKLGQIPGLQQLGAPRLEFKVLAGGRSGARVLMLSSVPQAEQPDNLAAVIVKIAPYEKVAQEKANFDRFVGQVLPVELRPELLGFAATHDVGALCYSCASPAGISPRTLTDHLNEGDAQVVRLVLQKLGDGLRRSWYDAAATRLEQCIADRYQRRFFKDPSTILSSEAKLARDAALYFGAGVQSPHYSIDDVVFPSPCAVLFDQLQRLSFRSCVIHGDLNSDNIIASPDDDRVHLVDFEHVGEGHVYEDLASIEASIRINYPNAASFTQILECERLIADPCGQGPDNAYAQAVADVRRTAMWLFGSVDDASRYHFAIAAIGLRLMQAIDLQDYARARITASTLWATQALAKRYRL